MSYGVAAFGSDGKLTFHSDYSSIVYAGEFTKEVDATRPVYTGDYHIPITASLKDSNYDMGWIIQYKITLDVDYMVPFYKPAFNGQEIAIMDIINDGTTWVINLLFSGNSLQYPYVYAFAPLSELPSSSVTLNSHGIVVYNSSSEIVFTDSKRPLRIDDVVTITHPSNIRTASKGTCGNSNTCHVNFTPDQSTTYTGSVNNTTSKLYHIVPSAYGGLAFENSFQGVAACGFLNLFDREYAWSYKSWASFRGTVKHPRGGATHVADWEADYAGAAHQYVQGDCGIGGLLGALIGAFLVVFTGGAALLVIGGALAGFAIGELSVGTTPSLKAYDDDEVFDQNGRPVNLLITDTSYYGITDNGDVDVTDRITFSYVYNTTNTSNNAYWNYGVAAISNVYNPYFGIVIDGLFVVIANVVYTTYSVPAATATTYTVGNTTYYRGDLKVTTGTVGTNSTYDRKYEVAAVVG